MPDNWLLTARELLELKLTVMNSSDCGWGLWLNGSKDSTVVALESIMAIVRVAAERESRTGPKSDDADADVERLTREKNAWRLLSSDILAWLRALTADVESSIGEHNRRWGVDEKENENG